MSSSEGSAFRDGAGCDGEAVNSAEINGNSAEMNGTGLRGVKTSFTGKGAAHGAAAWMRFEYSASEIRKILQVLFPQRQLVLSQFTFFNQIGVAKPTGETFRRGRRCYRLTDVLSIACVLALKEEGIPLKNIELVPPLIQEHAEQIFIAGIGSRLCGYGDEVALSVPGFVENAAEQALLDQYLSAPDQRKLFWGFDVGVLAEQLIAISTEQHTLPQAQQAA